MPLFAADSPAQQSDAVMPIRSCQVHQKTQADAEAHTHRIRVKNRRKRYLDLHPEYFSDASLELADPLLYDRLIRRFQSASEREALGRSRGYTGSLEADLVRSEAKLAALRQPPDPNNAIAYRRAADGSIVGVERGEGSVYTKEEGLRRWRNVMGQRFLRGEDGDFEYEKVDEDEGYDDREEEARERLEEYLGEEEEEFVGSGEKPEGETGVLDY